MLSEAPGPTGSTTPRRDERGSVAMVVMVLFVMASLATIMVARHASEMRQVRRYQDRAAALGLTDAGLSEGIARAAIESTGTFTDAGTGPGGGWTSSASRLDPARWQIAVHATVHGATRGVQVDLVRRGGSGWVVTDWQEIG